MNRKRMVVMLAGSALVFGGVFGFVAFKGYMITQFFANRPVPVVTVTAAIAQERPWTPVVAAVGTLRAVNGVDVAATVAGQVREISFESGQPVKKGQVLVRLDNAVEMGNLRSAQADADLARLQAERQRTLLKSNTVAQAALDTAEATLKSANARLFALAAQIEKRQIEAPFDGVLGVRKIDLGQYLQPGQAIVTLQDLSAMLADFTVSQKDLALAVPGRAVRMWVDAAPGRVFDGQVLAVEPKVDDASGMVSVRAHFANPDLILRPGMFVRMELADSASRPVVTVPALALNHALHGDSVFVIQPANGGDAPRQVRRAMVQAGERRDGEVVIVAGLTGGELVVTSGQLKLENGSPVSISDDDPMKAPAKGTLE